MLRILSLFVGLCGRGCPRMYYRMGGVVRLVYWQQQHSFVRGILAIHNMACLFMVHPYHPPSTDPRFQMCLCPVVVWMAWPLGAVVFPAGGGGCSESVFLGVFGTTTLQQWTVNVFFLLIVIVTSRWVGYVVLVWVGYEVIHLINAYTLSMHTINAPCQQTHPINTTP